MTQKLVLDVDTGTDDAVAIMLAALHPDLDLRAVTTVNGNVPVDHCTENSLRVLDYIGRSDVPVYEGAAAPIARPDFPVPRSKRGVSNVHGEYLDIPPSTSQAHEGDGAHALTSFFAGPEGQGTVLVATGPLTNVALAIKLDPKFVSNVR